MTHLSAIALTLFIAMVPIAQAGEQHAFPVPVAACETPGFCLPLPKINHFCTREVCRRPFFKAKCIWGEIVQIPFVEVTYETTDACGKTVVWKKIYRGCDSDVPSLK